MKSIKVRIVFKRSDTIAIIRNHPEANLLNEIEIVKVIASILADRTHVIVIIQEIDLVLHDEITEITETIGITIGTTIGTNNQSPFIEKKNCYKRLISSFIAMADDGRHSQIGGIKEDAVQCVRCHGIIGIVEVSAAIEIGSQSEDAKSRRDEKNRATESTGKEIDPQAEHEVSAPTVQHEIKIAKMLQCVNAAEADHVIDRNAKKIAIRRIKWAQQIKLLNDDR